MPRGAPICVRHPATVQSPYESHARTRARFAHGDDTAILHRVGLLRDLRRFGPSPQNSSVAAAKGVTVIGELFRQYLSHGHARRRKERGNVRANFVLAREGALMCPPRHITPPRRPRRSVVLCLCRARVELVHHEKSRSDQSDDLKGILTRFDWLLLGVPPPSKFSYLCKSHVTQLLTRRFPRLVKCWATPI